MNEFLTRELAEDGYSGVEVRVTPSRTEIIIMATRTQNVLGEKGRRIRELTAVVQKRYVTGYHSQKSLANKLKYILDSTLPKVLLNFMLKRSPQEDFAPSLRLNHSATN